MYSGKVNSFWVSGVCLSAKTLRLNIIAEFFIDGISTDLSGSRTNDKLEASERRVKKRCQIVIAAAQAGQYQVAMQTARPSLEWGVEGCEHPCPWQEGRRSWWLGTE